MRNRSVRPYLALAAALALAALALGGSAAALSEAQAPLRAATIDAKLTQQLAANPIGGVAAIVTAWNHDDLDEIESLGVQRDEAARPADDPDDIADARAAASPARHPRSFAASTRTSATAS